MTSKRYSVSRWETVRRFMGNPVITVFVLLSLVFSMCFAGTRTIWQGYEWWRTPGLLAGAISTITLIGVGLGLRVFLKFLFRSKFDSLRETLPRWSRRGYLTLGFLLAATVVSLAAFLVPVRDPYQKMFLLLESLPDGLDLTTREIERLRKRPVFSRSDAFRLAQLVVDYKQHQAEWRDLNWDDLSRKTYDFTKSPSPNVAAWARILYGDALLKTQRRNEALANFTEMTRMKGLSPHLSCEAWSRRGYTLQVLGDYENALKAWLEAEKYESSIRALLNIATCYQDLDDLDKARFYGEKAIKALKEASRRRSMPRDELVRYHNNVAELRRRIARTIPDATERRQAYERAQRFIAEVITLDPAYLDAYWTGVHIALDQKDFNQAMSHLDACRKILADPGRWQGGLYNDLEYEEYAEPYTAWLYLRVCYCDGRRIPDDDLWSFITAKISGLTYRTYETLKNTLDHVSNRGYSIPECTEALEDMRTSGYLDSLIKQSNDQDTTPK